MKIYAVYNARVIIIMSLTRHVGTERWRRGLDFFRFLRWEIKNKFDGDFGLPGLDHDFLRK